MRFKIFGLAPLWQIPREYYALKNGVGLLLVQGFRDSFWRKNPEYLFKFSPRENFSVADLNLGLIEMNRWSSLEIEKPQNEHSG